MTTDELRALAARIVADRQRPPEVSPAPAAGDRHAATHLDAAGHPSHAIYVAIVNVDNACVIEPDVACNHCNYCKSHGH
jgi:hypothetical protein